MSMLKSRKVLFILGGLLASTAVAGLGVWLWRGHVIKVQEERSLQRAKELIAAGQGSEALGVIRQRNRATKKQTEAARNTWIAMELEAATQADALPRLLAIYERSPAAFNNQESATLSLSRALLHGSNFEKLAALRAEWKGRESLAARWFELDVDTLLMQGKREEAIQLLNSKNFPGADDCGRLARLALLNTPANLNAAWQYLEQAAKLSPRNAEVRVFRGQILEGVGQLGLAHNEFQAAFNANTNSAYLREQLADFLRRNGRYDLALLAWTGGLTNSQATDWQWLRAAFWTKVTRTVELPQTLDTPFGPNRSFVQYLLKLPNNKFWDASAFTALPEASRYDKQLQEAHWLRLLDALQNGQEDEAARTLEFNPFRQQSWHPELESALIRLLAFRKTGRFKFPVNLNLTLGDTTAKTRHPMLAEIDQLTRDQNRSIAPEMDRLFRGKNAFAALFLACGWAEAALRLPHDDVMPADSPAWLAYGFAQALRFNRGISEALAFATRQKADPTLEVLQCELLLAEQKTEEALRRLGALAVTDSDVGQRATQLIAETRFEQKQYDAAKAAVMALPKFASSVAGQIMLARVALVQNQTQEATRIYQAIQAESDEAKMFLAKKAFQDREWKLARQLTEELLKKYPERTEFRVNLAEITKAEAQK